MDDKEEEVQEIEAAEESKTVEEPMTETKKARKKREKSPKDEDSLATQSAALRRLIKNSEISVVDLGERIGVEKQTIFLWMRGNSLIPENMVKKLAEIFGVHPAEIRYDLPAFNKEDLKSVALLLELFLKSQGKELDPESKAKAIVYLYGKKQRYRRSMLKKFAESEFETEVNEYLETL